MGRSLVNIPFRLPLRALLCAHNASARAYAWVAIRSELQVPITAQWEPLAMPPLKVKLLVCHPQSNRQPGLGYDSV